MTNWDWVTHRCFSKLTFTGSSQTTIWNNAGILLIGPVGSEISIEINTFSIKENTFENVVRKMATILPRPQWVKKLLFKRRQQSVRLRPVISVWRGPLSHYHNMTCCFLRSDEGSGLWRRYVSHTGFKSLHHRETRGLLWTYRETGSACSKIKVRIFQSIK